MRRLDHCNIVSLLYFFYTSGEKKVRTKFNINKHWKSLGLIQTTLKRKNGESFSIIVIGTVQNWIRIYLDPISGLRAQDLGS
jgi:hypothetical protein